MPHVLFVCTGNIFRSALAEKALRHAAGPGSSYAFSSAGTEAAPQDMVDLVRRGLSARGIDPGGHIQRKLTLDLLSTADLVVAMGLDHAAFIEEHYGTSVPLFNEVAFGQREAVLDTWEAVPDHAQNTAARNQHIERVVDHICEAAAPFLASVPHFLRR